jgi:phosphate transport system protein
MRRAFDRDLEVLHTSLIRMAGTMEDSLEKAITALRTSDFELARSVIAGDKIINDMEKGVESICMRLLLTQQPVAGDLRAISTALKMVTDMERIGDHATDISEIVLRIGNDPLIKDLTHITAMAKEAISMVRRSVDAFINADLELAEEVQSDDDKVDALFDTIMQEVIDYLAGGGANPGQAIDLLMIAKYLERVGDHAENIAEWVVFSITGDHTNTRLL